MQAPLKSVVKFTMNVNFSRLKNKTPGLWPGVFLRFKG
jgi:hypothetical protein